MFNLLKFTHRYTSSKFQRLKLLSDLNLQPINNFKQAFTLLTETYKCRNYIPHTQIQATFNKIEKVFRKSNPNPSFIETYLLLSRLNLMDNFTRKMIVQKIVGVLESLSDGRLVTTSYFLLTYVPFHDIEMIQNYSLKFHQISDRTSNQQPLEFIFGMKTDFVLKKLGFQAKPRKVPTFNIQSITAQSMLELVNCRGFLGVNNQKDYQLMERLIFYIFENDTSNFVREQSMASRVDDMIYDPLSYEKLSILYQISGLLQLQTHLTSRINSFFWRKFQSQMIDFCSAVRILKVLLKNPEDYAYVSISKNINEVISGMDSDDLKSAPLSSVIQYMRLFEKSSFFPQVLKKFQQIILAMDYTEEQLNDIRQFYQGRSVSERMHELIKNDD